MQNYNKAIEFIKNITVFNICVLHCYYNEAFSTTTSAATVNDTVVYLLVVPYLQPTSYNGFQAIWAH